jgi:hypothetical protein
MRARLLDAVVAVGLLALALFPFAIAAWLLSRII